MSKPSRIKMTRSRGGTLLNAEGNQEVEGAPFAQFTFHPNAAIPPTDQPGANCQSESGASVYARHGTVGLGKRFEDFALFVGRDSNTGILDGKMQAHGLRRFTFLLHRDEDLTAF